MALKAGIVGLPNVGKSTLFNALTNSKAESANYAFTTIEPNVSIVDLPDPRLITLNQFVNSKKIIPANFEFVDIAGLVKGASQGEGLGNKFLANIREVDLIVHVVRAFKNKDVLHIASTIDPIRDIETINLELLLSDLQIIDHVLQKNLKKAINSKNKELMAEMQILKKFKKNFAENNLSLRDQKLNHQELLIAKKYQFLTIKPIIYVANLDAISINTLQKIELFQKITQSNDVKGKDIIPISVKIEHEISLMESQEDKDLFLQEYDIVTSGLDLLIKKSFENLHLRTFFTVGVEEIRAWVFKDGQNAQVCAGIIHTDFANKFIKAKIISYKDYIENKGEKIAQIAGKVRLEGKSYLMKDGDIAHFKFGG